MFLIFNVWQIREAITIVRCTLYKPNHILYENLNEINNENVSYDHILHNTNKITHITIQSNTKCVLFYLFIYLIIIHKKIHCI